MAGRASPLKAYYVERNRLYLVVKNFPAGMLIAAPFCSLVRYFWHLTSMRSGEGAASEFRGQHGGLLLIWLVVKAHLAALAALGQLLLPS